VGHLLIHDLGITAGEFAVRLLPFTFIMILLLIVGGAITSQASNDGGPAAGASIAVGFGTMTVLSIVLFSSSVSGAGITTMVFVGVVYPVVFGGIGGLAG
jgi:hypothetical protein